MELFTKRQLTTKSKLELREIARRLGIKPLSDDCPRADWIDAILEAQAVKESVTGPEVQSQTFKPTKIARSLPVITTTQTYPRPKPEAEE